MYLVVSHWGRRDIPKTLVAALALVACSVTSGTFAQSSDGSDGTGSGGAPTLIMPGLLTNPMTSGLDSEGSSGAAAPAERDARCGFGGPLLGGGRRDAGSEHQLGERP